jgi:hypothetical protein
MNEDRVAFVACPAALPFKNCVLARSKRRHYDVLICEKKTIRQLKRNTARYCKLRSSERLDSDAGDTVRRNLTGKT